jgi:hypothetical protein
VVFPSSDQSVLEMLTQTAKSLDLMAKSLDVMAQKIDSNEAVIRALDSSVRALITQAQQKSETERISRLETRIGVSETARGDRPPWVQDSGFKAGAATVPKKMKRPSTGQKRSYEHVEDQYLNDHGVEEGYSRGNGGGSKRQKPL